MKSKAITGDIHFICGICFLFYWTHTKTWTLDLDWEQAEQKYDYELVEISRKRWGGNCELICDLINPRQKSKSFLIKSKTGYKGFEINSDIYN